MNAPDTLPHCFHIGMPKSGSKFFNNLLKQHPGIVFNAGQKNFYAAHFGKGFEWYLSQFEAGKDKTRVDLSPRLFMEGEKAALRINQYVENPRFLLILRNPVNFVYSYYRMHHNKGLFLKNHSNIFRKNPSFEEVMERFPEYLERGKYHEKFKIWLQYFDLSQFKVILFDDFVKEPQRHMDEVFDFFHVDKIEIKYIMEASKNITLKNPFFYKVKKFIIRRERLKERLKHSRMFDRLFDFFLAQPTRIPERYKKILQEYFREDVQYLSRLLEIDLLEKWLN